jgi:hypothetical protein
MKFFNEKKKKVNFTANFLLLFLLPFIVESMKIKNCNIISNKRENIPQIKKVIIKSNDKNFHRIQFFLFFIPYMQLYILSTCENLSNGKLIA